MKKYNMTVIQDTLDDIYYAYKNNEDFSITYEFPEDNVEIDLCVYKGNHNAYIEMVIFKDGNEECSLVCEIETSGGIIGEWEFTDHDYIVVLEEEK